LFCASIVTRINTDTLDSVLRCNTVLHWLCHGSVPACHSQSPGATTT
jgi:hypothetical protein